MKSTQHTPQEYAVTDTQLEAGAPAFEAISAEKHQRLFQNGMRWLGVGALLLVSSFGVNYLLFDSGTSFVTIMYVMTTLGILCIVKCLANVLGF